MSLVNSQEEQSPRIDRNFLLRNLLIFCFILVLVIDTTPAVYKWHEKFQEWVDPILDIGGLWQGRWELFAPGPSQVNTALTAEIKLKDGTVSHWSSPNPRDWDTWEKFRNFRWSEYFDTIRLDAYSDGWPAFTDWLVRDLQEEGMEVVEIDLYRHLLLLDKDTLGEAHPFPYKNRRLIYTRRYPE